MKKIIFLPVFFFILLPMAYSVTFDDEMERIYRKNTGDAQEDWDAKIIPVVPDGKGHLLVDTVLNGEVHASLTLDTGSPVLCLTSDIAQRLDLDLDNMKDVGEIMLLNGKHKVAHVNLKSVDLGGVEQENVPAVVFLDNDKTIADAFNDGLLGLSFLKKFNFTLDEKNRELILRKK
ncbi:MAG: TIGR02281 family clan AA aspartic protease [Candidatus Omnitrophica bacterium]|nr:TIGR02281 family clan AA aspartic protease [Candidatus Omnitrophota bacterium]